MCNPIQVIYCSNVFVFQGIRRVCVTVGATTQNPVLGLARGRVIGPVVARRWPVGSMWVSRLSKRRRRSVAVHRHVVIAVFTMGTVFAMGTMGTMGTLFVTTCVAGAAPFFSGAPVTIRFPKAGVNGHAVNLQTTCAHCTVRASLRVKRHIDFVFKTVNAHHNAKLGKNLEKVRRVQTIKFTPRHNNAPGASTAIASTSVTWFTTPVFAWFTVAVLAMTLIRLGPLVCVPFISCLAPRSLVRGFAWF